ncbi:hypothetical protein GV054_13665 [Marinomonas mediterranea]|uniref:PatG domain-containing protein n=1 Tax=Marinomonas mediterranea (strain ATCC 700492 / JCM 21426 / NBRC 103028 / MMB-1) TaxID=717774 RepID=F2JYA7_MARM1|nr:hypothetical protein [Marinomonas mediterranea]ADZ91938.1 hypothetical protein Marme_2707 [Marinomonas mediterranea MMB-1]WCN13970.1 hypothetical protein GV054_13665 [Marinomonas mediterranea]WCN18021.1 hypothetical protein GV053_13690 [Marinomonas mediterranea MMB-1]
MNTTNDISEQVGLHEGLDSEVIQRACHCTTAGCTCDSTQPVYALGELRPFFPSLDLQKEFAAAASSLNLKPDDYYGVFSYSYTDSSSGLSFRPYLYLAEKACWAYSINNVDTYLVVPRFQNELDALIDALNPSNSPQQSSLIGELGGLAPDGKCDDLRLPIVICNHVESNSTKDMAPISLQLNDGASNEHRAINFLVFNYAAILPKGLDLPKELLSLTYQPYQQTGRSLVELVLTYYEQGVEESYSCGIDVTDQYPFVDFPLRRYVPTNP